MTGGQCAGLAAGAYLDHAATTPLRPEARAAMLPWLGGRHGNPSGMHRSARVSRTAVEEARDEVAELLGCRPAEVVFTSGGTEADNLAVFGTVGGRGRGDGSGPAAATVGGRPVVCSAIEHHAVLEPVRAVGGATVPVGRDGLVDLAAVPADAAFISVMLVNNEIGVVQPLAAVRAAAPDAVLHTDAVQAVTWLDLRVAAAPAQLVSISAHKFGGPMGVGALVVREGVALRPQLLGGGQERERRSGTSNVAGIVGMAAALRACHDSRAATVARLAGLRDHLADALLAAVPASVETGARLSKVAGLCSLAFDGVDAEALLVLLDQEGISASAGASCASGALEPSHVLAALGVPASVGGGALRLSLGWDTQPEEVEWAIEVVPAAVARLRAYEP